MTTGLLLVGHGSHITAETAGLVWQHVDALRALNVADEVGAAFWKEQPAFSRALETFTADDITIVPLFTAQGYFTQTVIPAEMGLDGTLTRRDGRILRYTPTLNEHPYLGQVVRHRVESALASLNITPNQAAIAIIGHSTRRNRQSRQATEAQAQAVQAAFPAAQVQAVYLDDDPAIPSIYTLTDAPYLIAVPYFLALGSHTTIDVPEALGLPQRETHAHINGRDVFYTQPVGTDEALRQVILELAQSAGAPVAPRSGLVDAWSGMPGYGKAELQARLVREGELRFGQLRLRHDRVQPWADTEPQEQIDTPSQLRRRVREQSRFRSLSTSADLPGGWFVPTTLEQVAAVVETIYPGTVAAWTQAERRVLAPTPLAATVQRQTGDYRALADLTSAQQRAVAEQVCGGCIRRPLWLTDQPSFNPQANLPCPEACNHWLAAGLAVIESETANEG